MQKHPRSFLFSILPSSYSCAVFIPSNCRLLTLLRYPDLGKYLPYAALVYSALSSALPSGGDPTPSRTWVRCPALQASRLKHLGSPNTGSTEVQFLLCRVRLNMKDHLCCAFLICTSPPFLERHGIRV